MPAGFLICENLLPVPGEIVLWYCGRAVRIDEDLKRGGAGRSARSRARATTKVSIQTSADPRLLTYLQFYQKRLDGRSAPEIVAALEAGSPAELYTELKNYGFPVCEVCGATPVTGVHCKVPQTKHERQARGSARQGSCRLPRPRPLSLRMLSKRCRMRWRTWSTGGSTFKAGASWSEKCFTTPFTFRAHHFLMLSGKPFANPTTLIPMHQGSGIMKVG